MTNSLRKGKAWERACVHIFNERTGAKWCRTPCSGGFATAQDIEDKRFQADLFSEDPRFSNWCVECKITAHKLNLETPFNPGSPIWTWWEQTASEAKDKIPILVFKYFHSSVFIVSTHEEVISLLCKDGTKFAKFIDSEKNIVLNVGWVMVKPSDDKDDEANASESEIAVGEANESKATEGGTDGTV